MSPIIPSYLKQIVPYEPGKPIEELQRELGLKEIVKLASNESPFGPPQACLDKIQEISSGLNRYPDDSYFRLKQKISEKFDVDDNNIMIGAGSAELIVYAARALLGPSDYAAISEQTFIMYWLAVQQVNGNLIRIPLQNYTYNLESMAAAISERVKVVYIANPNNPTGTMITAGQFDRFMDALPEHVTVVYDEAYREYIDDPDYPDPLKYYRRGDKIIVLRTFSKIYGLAGLRVGYGIMRDSIMDALRRVRLPFNVTSLGAAAAEVALDADEHIKEVLKVNSEGRDYLIKEMSDMGLNVIPSVTNFLLVDFDFETRDLFLAMQKKGVIVRPMAAFGMPTALRITIGFPEENKKFIDALKATL